MPLAFDTTGLQRHDERTWFDPRTGDQVSLTYFDLEPDLPASLEELPLLRQRLAHVLAEAGTLVEAHVVTIDSVPALYQVVKLPIPGRQTGLMFVAALTVPKATGSVVLQVLCQEGNTSGIRESMVSAQIGFENCFPPHPYAPGLQGMLPWNVADDQRWDNQFPEHPLSRARAWAHRTIQTARVDPNFARLPPFRPQFSGSPSGAQPTFGSAADAQHPAPDAFAAPPEPFGTPDTLGAPANPFGMPQEPPRFDGSPNPQPSAAPDAFGTPPGSRRFAPPEPPRFDGSPDPQPPTAPDTFGTPPEPPQDFRHFAPPEPFGSPADPQHLAAPDLLGAPTDPPSPAPTAPGRENPFGTPPEPPAFPGSPDSQLFTHTPTAPDAFNTPPEPPQNPQHFTAPDAFGTPAEKPQNSRRFAVPEPFSTPPEPSAFGESPDPQLFTHTPTAPDEFNTPPEPPQNPQHFTAPEPFSTPPEPSGFGGSPDPQPPAAPDAFGTPPEPPGFGESPDPQLFTHTPTAPDEFNTPPEPPQNPQHFTAPEPPGFGGSPESQPFTAPDAFGTPTDPQHLAAPDIFSAPTDPPRPAPSDPGQRNSFGTSPEPTAFGGSPESQPFTQTPGAQEAFGTPTEPPHPAPSDAFTTPPEPPRFGESQLFTDTPAAPHAFGTPQNPQHVAPDPPGIPADPPHPAPSDAFTTPPGFGGSPEPQPFTQTPGIQEAFGTSPEPPQNPQHLAPEPFTEPPPSDAFPTPPEPQLFTHTTPEASGTPTDPPPPEPQAFGTDPADAQRFTPPEPEPFRAPTDAPSSAQAFTAPPAEADVDAPVEPRKPRPFPAPQAPAEQPPTFRPSPVRRKPQAFTPPEPEPVAPGDVLHTVLVGVPIGDYLPLWQRVGEKDTVTFWRMSDPDAVRARLGTGVESRSAVDTGRYREAAMFSPERQMLFLMDRFRDDSGNLGGTSEQLFPATEEEAYQAADDKALSGLYSWLGEVMLAAVRRGEFVAVETGGWDVPVNPVVLVMLRTDGREWHSVVETSPVPVGAPVWRDQQPVEGSSQILASPATDQTLRASGLLTRFAINTWSMHPFQLGISFGPNPTLEDQ